MTAQPKVVEMPKRNKADLFADVLKKSAKTEAPKKTKATMRTLDPPTEVRDAVDKLVRAKEAEKKAKAEKAMAETAIIDWARQKQDEDGKNDDYQKSYIVPGNDEQVKFITSSKYSINADDQEEIQKLLGEHFESLIESKFKVTLKPEVLEDDEMQAELFELIGERLPEFFDTTTYLQAHEDFGRKIYKVDVDLAEVRMFVRQYKPSLR
jgi:hypothetical protein